MPKKVILELTEEEASALRHAADSGTLDDAIDCIGFKPHQKAAYRRADRKLTRAIREASE